MGNFHTASYDDISRINHHPLTNMRDAPNSNAELNRATSYDVSLKIATSLTHIEEDKPNRKGWHISYTQRKLTLEIAKSSIFYGMPPNSNAEGNSYSIVMMWSLKLAHPI